MATTNFRNEEKRFGIKSEDRRRHVYIIGKTGTGKSTLSENMAIQDIRNGHGLAVVDPHGEFAEDLLNYIPSERVNDVVYFNPSDLDWPIALNAIEKVAPQDREIVVSGLMGIFKKIWPDVWSARMEYILSNVLWALIEHPGTTLLGINRMLSDKKYRDKIVDGLKDPAIKAYWLNEFNNYPDKFREEAIVPIQNKVGQFISSPLIRNIIGQTKSLIDMRQIMDEGKILILNLSKGRIGEEASRLLGALFITKLQLAAMSRVDVPEDQRRDFYLYVDEFQNFATDSFANILSEARKYRLNLILAHQYVKQLINADGSSKVKDAIFGNVGTIVSFRIGADDAEFMEPEFTPEFMIEDFVNLPFAHIYIKLMIDGTTSRPFSATTLPLFPRPETSQMEKIIRVSRERYGKPRKEVEEKFAKWSGLIPENGEERKPTPSNNKSGINFEKSWSKKQEQGRKPVATVSFTDECWRCGARVELNFKPDRSRPIYCKECLKGAQREQARAQKEAETRGGEKVLKPETPESSPVKEFASLQEAVQKDRGRRSGAAKQDKPQIDLNGLRATLKKVLGNSDSGKQEPEKDEQTENKNKGELKAGQDVEL